MLVREHLQGRQQLPKPAAIVLGRRQGNLLPTFSWLAWSPNVLMTPNASSYVGYDFEMLWTAATIASYKDAWLVYVSPAWQISHCNSNRASSSKYSLQARLSMLPWVCLLLNQQVCLLSQCRALGRGITPSLRRARMVIQSKSHLY